MRSRNLLTRLICGQKSVSDYSRLLFFSGTSPARSRELQHNCWKYPFSWHCSCPAGIPSLHPVTIFLFSRLSPLFRAVKGNSGREECGEKGVQQEGLWDWKELWKKATLCIFNRKRKKTLNRVNGSPLTPYWSVHYFLVRCKAPVQMSWPISEGSVDTVTQRIPHPQGDTTGALGVASFNSTPMDWNCSSQHLSVVQREELVTGTFISDTGHLQAVKNTSCQISALNQVGKRISISNYQHTGKHSVFGAAAYCVSCDLHQQPLSDCESMTEIPSLFTLK